MFMALLWRDSVPNVQAQRPAARCRTGAGAKGRASCRRAELFLLLGLLPELLADLLHAPAVAKIAVSRSAHCSNSFFQLLQLTE
jgi:hypothetical protein